MLHFLDNVFKSVCTNVKNCKNNSLESEERNICDEESRHESAICYVPYRPQWLYNIT